MLRKKIYLLLTTLFLFTTSFSSFAQVSREDCPEPEKYGCGLTSGANSGLAGLESVIMVGVAITAATLVIYTIQSNITDDDYRANVLAHSSKGRGVRLNSFDSIIDISMFTSNTLSQLNTKRNSEDPFRDNQVKRHVNLVSLAVRW